MCLWTGLQMFYGLMAGGLGWALCPRGSASLQGTREECVSGAQLNEGAPGQRESGAAPPCGPQDSTVRTCPSHTAQGPRSLQTAVLSRRRTHWGGGGTSVGTQDRPIFCCGQLSCHSLQAWTIQGQSLRTGRGLMGFLAPSPPHPEQEPGRRVGGGSRDESRHPGARLLP